MVQKSKAQLEKEANAERLKKIEGVSATISQETG